jgi:DNA anti-recombination protein RmuC
MPDFVFLFLPGEHFLNTALEVDPTLIEEGVNQCVLIATPTTLIALLRAVAYGWQQEKVAESAQAVAEIGRDLHKRLANLADHLQTVGKRLRARRRLQRSRRLVRRSRARHRPPLHRPRRRIGGEGAGRG